MWLSLESFQACCKREILYTFSTCRNILIFKEPWALNFVGLTARRVQR